MQFFMIGVRDELAVRELFAVKDSRYTLDLLLSHSSSLAPTETFLRPQI